MATYIATQGVGEFMAGDEVSGFNAAQIKTFLAEGVIKEIDEPKPAPKRTTKADDKEG
ncbi:hypothetical protein [Psychrobacter pygoscelis]|uniref:hypothetical protein n=1 Tax=Psychrobacter pygoscelis TaxID=2488563 RepID=UPI0013F3F477|nr:hypothetical protein [Psychrobacter pygoscelis]